MELDILPEANRIEEIASVLLLADELDSIDTEYEHTTDERHKRLTEDEATSLGALAL